MISPVFENENFFICDKESGFLSTPSRHQTDDNRRCLGTELQAQLGIQIYPVHRLDFEVSGLVMYAKNPRSHKEANAWFESKTIQKTYRALTDEQDFSHIPANVPNKKAKIDLCEEQEFHWESCLLRGKRRAYESPQGKPSLTLAHFLKRNENGFLEWNLQPVTGRSHQLRFDMSRHGFPIIGDELYGSKKSWKENSIALRAFKIDFSRVKNAATLGLPPVVEVIAL